MATYQCFFLSEGVIQYWENVDLDVESQLLSELGSRLIEHHCISAEAWLGETLVCRVNKNAQARPPCAA